MVLEFGRAHKAGGLNLDTLALLVGGGSEAG